jgi:ectoine hydroxylase-related dioxygenase (phytanoyl-CoA dioxygenase family)
MEEGMATSIEDCLGESEFERFWRDGALCLRGLFVDWIQPMQAAIEEVLAQPGPLAQDPARRDYRANEHTSRQSFHIELGLWTRHATFRAFALESPAPAIAERLLNSSELNLFFDQLFVKEPESPEQRTPWHQDQSYWPISGEQVLSIWVPFDPVSEETGALRYVKGSHRWGRRFTPTDFGRAQRAVPGVTGESPPDIDANPERYETLSWNLEPGDCLVHHGMAMHGAPGNRSVGVRRRAHSLRFTGDDVRWDPRPGILERIPLMTTLPLSLAAGDRLTCDAFPVVRRNETSRAAGAARA